MADKEWLVIQSQRFAPYRRVKMFRFASEAEAQRFAASRADDDSFTFEVVQGVKPFDPQAPNPFL